MQILNRSLDTIVRMFIVDTHAHIYSPDEERYPPIEKPLRPPGGKGSLEDLHAESRANGVNAACIIQTSTFYRFDNRYILTAPRPRPIGPPVSARSTRMTATAPACSRSMLVNTASGACEAFQQPTAGSIIPGCALYGKQQRIKAS